MGLFFKKEKTFEVLAPFDGTVVPIESLKDQTFATKVMGDGIGIIPTSEEVICPIKGVISSLLDTKHAYGITSEDEFDLLIHIGQDTVEMNGDGFETFVKEGQQVKPKEKLGSFNISKIKEKGYEIATPIILIDGDFVIKEKTSATNVHAGDVLFTVAKK